LLPMRRALRKLGLAASLLVFAVSLSATNSPAPAAKTNANFIDPELLDGDPQVNHLMDAMKKQGVKTDSLMDEHFLFASLIWGSVGGGYLLYARKQRAIVPFLGGVAMIAVSFLVASWLWMSVFSVALMVAVYQLMQRGY